MLGSDVLAIGSKGEIPSRCNATGHTNGAGAVRQEVGGATLML